MRFEVITLKKKEISDFAGERNSLIQKSKSEWILFLDSDEKISPGLKSELENTDTDGFSGFYIFRKNKFLGKPIGTDKILRLAKRNSGKWERKVHETWKVKGVIGQLENPIIHETAKNLSEYLKKVNIYSSLHAQENLKEGKRSGLFKIIFYPPLKFFQSILSGRGFVFSMLQSLHSFLAWSKQWNLQKD